MSEDKDALHVNTLRNQWKLNRRARKKAAGADELKAFEEALSARAKPARAADPPRGQLVGGKGIYIGTWAPKDKEGRSLGKVFNVYAAPEDLPHKMNYVDTVEYIASLEGWHGHDGEDCLTDAELREILKNGGYKGGWFIPPRELLVGRDAKGDRVQADSLFAHKDKGALRGAFPRVVMSSHDHSRWYWSSTELPEHPKHMHNARFSDRGEAWDAVDLMRVHCRPVRLEPA